MDTDKITRFPRKEQPDREPGTDPPATTGPGGVEPMDLLRRLGVLLGGSAAALAVLDGTRIALSLTAVVGRRAELLLSIQPGPFAVGGGALALAVAWRARRVRRTRP